MKYFLSQVDGRAGKRKKKGIRRMTFFLVSGYRDSNAGPPAPKAGALTGLRYTPNLKAVLQGAF